MNTAIRYLKHMNIDPGKWDACVQQAANGSIYGYSFYLDHMARHWDGLVLGDYEAVMPLPWNSKYAVQYVYQPPFVAVSGIFGNGLNNDIINQFINAIPKHFRLVEINLNSGNVFGSANTLEGLRANFVLPLKASYEELANNYRQNIRRNVRKAREAGCVVKTNIPVNAVIELARQQLETVVKVSARDWQQFEKLYGMLQPQQQAVTYGVYNASNELLASAVFFFSHGRAYYILVGNHPNGKTLGASHFLLDRFIEDHAGTGLALDFEGSDIRSLAFFYSSFGAKQEVYPSLKINRLPWYLRWAKT
jgi:hypothetical protein